MPTPEHSSLSLIADLEREADLLVEAARAEARQMVEAARREADVALRGAREEAPEIEQRAFADEVARGREEADALRREWSAGREARDAHIGARLPLAVAAVVEAVLGGQKIEGSAP
ncbi:MAG: V-type ATPase subunit subunit G family protein [Armatimonadota bacterium]|nr:V-type ATPase subunit subunit G family protein [Armatimonadota bacterium]MDR7485511.1 V-type ATPase subunit subunit G family protein [Armatimonadota bacterium]MDR7533056.1 V-type ATPase subunit subunit G family protein [Armatimonadota bacterium]MDR7536772.1 V-type ATPase subunit subunit G family protein [Armatimonadota bacterium]